jgi:hypothetical protein
MSACRLSPCALSPSDSLRMGTPVNVRGHILHTPRTAEWLQSIGHSRVRKSRTRRASGAPRRVVPASGVTGKSEASEEFCKEVDAAARWNRHREQRRLGEGH